MGLRPHQQQLKEIVDLIDSGNKLIEDIFIFAAPGGGKSLCPVILSDLLTNGKKQIWVVPRDSLKYQGEADYHNDFYPVDKVARVADNAGDPFRGCDCAITTYQAIGANPQKWIDICKQYDVMLILDEFHHLSESGEWVDAIRPMKESSFLSVFMTGTINRGDGTALPFVPYDVIDIDFSSTDKIKWIVYSYNQAIKDGAVLPFLTCLVQGSGRYIDKEGIEREFAEFGNSSDHLKAAFQTEYAYHLLDLTIQGWKAFKKNHHWSKLLIVAPDIATAKDYLQHMKMYQIKVDIATSDNNTACKENIKRFKKNNYLYGALECIVTVGVAYEGLSVPEITHTGLLTMIRSIPWLEQCLARGTRNYPGKTRGFVYAPKDPKLLKAIKSISVGKILSISAESEGKTKDATADPLEESAWTPPQIEALYSKADIDGAIIPDYAEFVPDKLSESQSQKEKRLRKEINSVINRIVGTTAAGNRKIKEQIFWKRAKRIINKSLKELSIPELEQINEFAQTYK